MRGPGPPGLEFRILCLEGSVISFISPSSGVCMCQGAFVHVQHVLKQFIFFYARGILKSLLFLHRGRGIDRVPLERKVISLIPLAAHPSVIRDDTTNIMSTQSMSKPSTIFWLSN